MATQVEATDITEVLDAREGDLPASIASFLKPIASLKLTVVLFALSIFIVLAGTLAQVEKDIWQVIDEYFRCSIARIELQIFFPPSFFPSKPIVPGWFPFPGGWAIGTAMAINLFAAHAVRFKIQAAGTRLIGGLIVIAIGCVVTWLVIVSGSSDGGGAGTVVSYTTLWGIFKLLLGVLWLACIYGLVMLGRGRRIEMWTLISSIVLVGAALVWVFYQGDAAQLGDSSMRILWQLAKGTIAGVVLLAGAMLVFKRRAGIVLIHGGIGLMMLSEILVGTSATEGQMRITEGQTTNFVEDTRTYELTVVDASPADTDEVVVVPRSILLDSLPTKKNLKGKRIQHDELPFDVQVVEYYRNSNLQAATPGGKNLATAGTGLQQVAVRAKQVSGTDQLSDLPASYVQLFKKGTGTQLGVYLVSLMQSFNGVTEKITVEDKTYDMSLRFKRSYRPYSMNLIDVRKDDYMGTDTPMNYSSQVRLIDTSQGVDRDVKIWMNNPLRFAGETFYQSGYTPAAPFMNTPEGTTLSVVTNSGWMIPYVSCMIVAVGLMAHFWGILVRFLKRRQSAGATALQKTASPEKPRFEATLAAYALPVLVVAMCALWIGSKAIPPKFDETEMNLYEFGKLPVVYKGRMKPLDTLARNSLRIVSYKQTFTDEMGTPDIESDDKKRRPAIQWLLDTIADPRKSFDHKVMRIENLEVLETLGLKPRKGYRYAISEFSPQMKELEDQAEMARNLSRSKGPEALSIYQRKILDIEQKLGVVYMLINSWHASEIRPDHVKDDVLEALRRQQFLAETQHPPLVVPGVDTKLEIPGLNTDGDWNTYAMAELLALILGALPEEKLPESATYWAEMLAAYQQNDVKAFNDNLANYQSWLVDEDNTPTDYDSAKIAQEGFFNNLQPCFQCWILYLFAFVLGTLAWLGFSGPLNRAAFWLIMFTFVIHSYALIDRMYISGRPPVTNLYSSAVFIGWGGVLLCLVLEAIYRLGIGNVVAAATGASTLLIAHYLAGDGDTFTVLQAVLDTQFWLATHVTSITLGYSTTFIAGVLGIIYVLRGLFTPTLSKQLGKDLARMIYGTLCFAIFFSFVGTVLGGLWADDSWGRFWGWDPKENGALIIVIWNALVLHARWGGMVKERGMAVLAVAGNICTSWSWFGVNELGVGLHSYGFTDGVLRALGLFVLSQMVIVMLGMIPLNYWLSYRRQQETS